MRERDRVFREKRKLQGLEKGLEQGRNEERLQLIRKMVSRGMSPELISDMTGLTIEEIKSMLA